MAAPIKNLFLCRNYRNFFGYPYFLGAVHPISISNYSTSSASPIVECRDKIRHSCVYFVDNVNNNERKLVVPALAVVVNSSAVGSGTKSRPPSTTASISLFPSILSMIKTRQRSTAALKNNASISLIPIRRYHLTRRKLCSSDDEKKSPLRLSNWKPIIWPSVFKTIRNWFLTFLIKGYLDASYTTSTFLDGAEQAVNFVSNCLSEGQLDDLKDLIDQQALEEAQHYLSLMSAAQKQQVAVNKDDMFLRYIHEIGMIFDDETGQRFVEITTVFQGMPGFSDLKEKGDPVRFQEQLKNRANELYICNYRFIREFTKGVDGDWKINRLNHFHPQEVVNVTPPFQR